MKKSSPRTVFFLGLAIAAVAATGAFGQARLEVGDSNDAVTLVGGTDSAIFFTQQGDFGGLYFTTAPTARQWLFLGLTNFVLQPLSGEVEVETILEGGLTLSSGGQIQRYVADSDDDNSTAFHIWHQDTTGAGDRLMQLESTDGGDLLIGGQLSTDQFDLAELFWEREPVEPGELVVIDPDRPDAVRRSGSAYQSSLLGVASERPGVVLGRRSFSLGDLRETWGEDVVAEYHRRRPALELEVLAQEPDLRAEAERLASPAAFAASLDRLRAEGDAGSARRRVEETGIGRASSPQALAAGYEKARQTQNMRMFDATARRFFGESFTAVALAGRVPVKVDASFGAINPGDYLTSSPIPGVAMKASRPGPIIGTALEGVAAGAGSIQVFVHRGWFGGEGPSPVAATPAAPRPDTRDLEIADLRRELAAMQERLDRLAGRKLAMRQARFDRF